MRFQVQTTSRARDLPKRPAATCRLDHALRLLRSGGGWVGGRRGRGRRGRRRWVGGRRGRGRRGRRRWVGGRRGRGRRGRRRWVGGRRGGGGGRAGAGWGGGGWRSGGGGCRDAGDGHWTRRRGGVGAADGADGLNQPADPGHWRKTSADGRRGLDRDGRGGTRREQQWREWWQGCGSRGRQSRERAAHADHRPGIG